MKFKTRYTCMGPDFKFKQGVTSYSYGEKQYARLWFQLEARELAIAFRTAGKKLYSTYEP